LRTWFSVDRFYDFTGTTGEITSLNASNRKRPRSMV